MLLEISGDSFFELFCIDAVKCPREFKNEGVLCIKARL